MTGESLIAQRLTVLYDVGVAFLAREAEKDESSRAAVDETLDNLDPPEQVEQTRRADGMLEHDPDLEIPGWGLSDPDEMGWGAPASASSGTVEDFDPT